MFSLETLWRAQYRLSQIGKRRTGSPRVLVIGVCQAGSIARVMRYLLPDAQVDFVSAFGAAKRFPRMADLIAHADRYDAVFTSIWLPKFKDGGTILDLRARPNVRAIPTIVFAAYHPDLVHVGVQDSVSLHGFISGPMGHSHSAVTLFAYLAGFSQEQALRLFSEPVFERLGYFDFWNESVTALRGLGVQADYDLDTHLTRWARRGCFMHSINHTKLYVVSDLARGLLTRAGIAYDACDLDAFVPDDLGGMGSWPVYPEIAGHYGIPGSALFFKAETPRSGPARTMTRAAYVAATYAYYDKRPREVLVNARVQTWRDDPVTVEFLREAAGRALSAARPAGRAPAMTGTLAGHTS
ncbi:WcbI family polysaccharide biosynthesis putative acetyltransferase [Methylobacterium sp. NEAU 140]|uniref:WcbI family polysaccharide biosynthesis putative acetyltransferase n=1 Tax=Methylobacterium sp. NEAU 140 TaxID=3064945 RepID=UPI002733DA74|nr:WcbI family polysaccharide biosynthesis putative acetyltransferase [Methylobacterium sp. NEAU 140]MDP4024824.1 WcbI family polysaccharide biosynthesis putative acetyltransferase [Methylobacterium sp. NEAU 140]